MTKALSERDDQRKVSVLSASGRSDTSQSYRCFQNYYHAHRYLNPNPQYISNVRSKVNHWQLRDLVQIDSQNGNIYHTFEDAIRVLPILPRSARLPLSYDYLRLPYLPRCFNHAPGGLIVTGGLVMSQSRVFTMNVPDLGRKLAKSSHARPLKGLFSFFGPHMSSELTFQLGEMINNAVTIYPNANTESSYTSYVCNNDSYLYTIDISDSGVKATSSICCETNTSLNNVHQSGDGRLLTATGDSGSVFLMDPKMDKQIFKTIKTNHDSGFGISYHHNQHSLAAAFQDGTCCLYDLRRLDEPMFEIKSTRPGHQLGAFRSCKFLSSPIQDLLIILEHVGRVHLIDFRDLSEENHQVIVFPYALDQFSRYKHQRLSVKDKLMGNEYPIGEDDEDVRVAKHKRFDVYSDEAAQFTAPLVYDYNYLAEDNPKLFKDFEYHPQPIPVCKPDRTYSSPRFNDPRWNSAPTSMNIECDPNESFNENSIGGHQEHLSIDPQDVRERLDLETSRGVVDECTNPMTSQDALRYCHDSYQQSAKHVHGEMELSGIDWFDNQLYIGCEVGGLLAWDVNVRARRSFGSFSYA